MGVHVFPILNPPSHLPPHPIPLGHPSALALISYFFSVIYLRMFIVLSPPPQADKVNPVFVRTVLPYPPPWKGKGFFFFSY